MSGHNKWSQIKHKKEIVDAKKAKKFSKILSAIIFAAREEKDPTHNSLLKKTIQQAHKLNVPQETIERALNKKDGDNLKEINIEAYAPGGISCIIRCITNNSNRTIAEIKHILSTNQGVMAKSGSVMWAFKDAIPQFPQKISAHQKEKTLLLIQKIEDHPDVQSILTNIDTQ